MSIYSSLRDGIQQIVYKIINPGVVMAVKAGITPNVVTTLGLLGNIAGAALLVYAALSANSDYVLIGWAGVVIILSSIMDMVDGYMARTANMCSVFGAFYDSVLDRYCELVTLSGLAFYFMHFSYPWAAVITFLSLIGSIMVSYVRARAEGLDLECKVGLMQRPERIVVTVLGMLLTGFLDGVVPFDSIWFIIASQAVIALFANFTAFHRILHVKNQLK
jgi:CDP-diacylglycerol--glycerol-3-phosphate 3-phosphatidyltransferase